jgi:aspartate/methionine/tyrosine aminotransferase
LLVSYQTRVGYAATPRRLGSRRENQVTLSDRFASLGIDNAPGQQTMGESPGLDVLDVPSGPVVDFSHGDVGAFEPSPGAFDAFQGAFDSGATQAYSEYRGHAAIREPLADRISKFIGAPVNGAEDLIITPGTQAALFLALSSMIGRGDKVAIVEPDYFANRKIVSYLEGEIMPVRLDYLDTEAPAALELSDLRDALVAGARLVVFSNPNNPTGVVYSADQISRIAELANEFDAFVVVDQLYSRLIYSGSVFTHLRASGIRPDRCITVLGPSKTESLSGFRTGVAVAPPEVIGRMEKLLAIIALRTAGYNQSVLIGWLNEPDGWLDNRITEHALIRDDLVRIFAAADGFHVRATEGGSYLFPQVPKLTVPMPQFLRVLRDHAGVIVTPGTEFSPHHGASVRLNFSQDRARAVDAAKRIVAVARKLTI